MTAPQRRIAAIGLAAAVLAVGFYYSHRLRRGLAPAASQTLPARGGALVGTIRGEPPTFNRYVNQTFPTQLISLLTQARLVRINRLTDQPEPWLASAWRLAHDARGVTLDLRPDLVWSDGAPFDSGDVVFSFAAAYGASGTVMAQALSVGGKPIGVRADGPRRVVLTFAQPYAPGVRLLDALPIYPRHALAASLASGTFAKAWDLKTSGAAMPGLGPFLIDSYTPGQRIVFVRNPRYWRRDPRGVALPYLDRLTLEIVPDQNAELLRLTSGQVDLTQTSLRIEDYREVKAAADAGRVRLMDVGPGLERHALWFNLGPKADPARAFLREDAFRAAVSMAVDRKAMANAVYLGAADPAPLPVPPANVSWQPQGLEAPAYDPGRAAALLNTLGLEDRDHDGVREDREGRPVRFSVLVQAGVTGGEKGMQFVRDELAKIGVHLDVVALDLGSVVGRWLKGDYDAVYHHVTPTDSDPAANMDWWLTSGDGHVWNPSQAKPATPWEAEIDTLMTRQAASLDLAERRRLFTEVQRIFLAHNPAIYFVAPRVYMATSRRVAPVTPAIDSPQLLWAADQLAVTAGKP